jgi:hypothetical protein
MPGVSGNPGGRPKGIVAATTAVVGDGRMLLEALLSIVLSEGANDADRIAAARELLDRRHGKAPAFGMIHTDGGSPAQAQLDAALLALLGEMRGEPAEVDGVAERVQPNA